MTNLTTAETAFVNHLARTTVLDHAKAAALLMTTVGMRSALQAAVEAVAPPVSAAAQPVRVVVNMTGGVLQGGAATVPVELIVLDYDATGYGDDDQDERLRDIPQADGTFSEAEVLEDTLEADEAWVAGVFAAIREPVADEEG